MVDSLMALKDRIFGYQFSGSEYRLIYERENMGYVRFLDNRKTRFKLDPSPFLPTQSRDIYILAGNCPIPPEGKLIEAIVLETERKIGKQIKNFNRFEYTIQKYVRDWKPEDPNKLVYDRLIRKEEFLDYLASPIPRRSYAYEDLQTCLGLSMVSAPQLSYIEPGGISTVVLGRAGIRRSWAAFKHSSTIIPTEFRQPTSTHFYKNCETAEVVRPVNSKEVSLSYPAIEGVPIHIPIPLPSDLKSYAEYKDDYRGFTPIARTYLLDAILFQPEIPDTLQKRLEETMYEIIEAASRANDIPYTQDLGSIVLKLTSSFARLDFTSKVTKDTIKESRDIWGEMMGLTKQVLKGSHLFKDPSDKKTDDHYQLLLELREMEETGVPLTITNLRARTKVFEWKFDDVLERLKLAGDVYFPSGDRIGLLYTGKK